MTIRHWGLLVLMLAGFIQLRPLGSSPVRAQDSSPQTSLSRAPLAALLQSIPETVALAQKEYNTSNYGGLNPMLDCLHIRLNLRDNKCHSMPQPACSDDEDLPRPV